MERYSPEIEEMMCSHFSNLSEKDKRHYAATEAIKIGRGGQSYISELFKITRYRIRRGKKELKNPDLCKEIPHGKQRHKGGGRKKKKYQNLA